MHRRAVPLLFALAAAGCGGAGQSTSTVMSPMDPTMRSGGNGAVGSTEETYKPPVGTNVPLGTLKTLSPKSVLAKAPEGKVEKESAAKLAKLGKDGLKFDDAYRYVVADATAPQILVGEKGTAAPLPADAKANPDGSYWVVDAETRRVYTLLGVKREEGKPATATEALSGDLVHPVPESVPPLALVARPDEASTGISHALRIVAKGVGAEGAPAEGTRIRLKKGVSEKDVPLLARSVMRALKKYGAILTPGEGGPALSALADPRWTKEDGKALGVLHLADFEVVTPPAKPVRTTKNVK